MLQEMEKGGYLRFQLLQEVGIIGLQAVSLYLQMCYFREWSLTGQPTNITDDEH